MTALMADSKFGLAIPGSTMKHSEFLVGAKIQQFVAKYGAAITSRIKVSPLASAPVRSNFEPNGNYHFWHFWHFCHSNS
jgi:hypothetical protein